jgi:hypothetical protein
MVIQRNVQYIQRNVKYILKQQLQHPRYVASSTTPSSDATSCRRYIKAKRDRRIQQL